MYLSFYNLRTEPFNMTPDPRFLFLSRHHEIALASLIYGIQFRKGFIALTGEVGTGKSTLCRALVSKMKKDVDFSVVLNPLLSVEGMLKAINQDFGNPIDSRSMDGQIEGLNQFLLQKLAKGRNAALLIDEAHTLSVQALEALRILSNLETDQSKLVQILLVGQPELEAKLTQTELRQLNQRISIRCRLEPLGATETRTYVYHRLSVAGGQGSVSFGKRCVVFEDPALEFLYKISQGVPRLINLYCDRALLQAFAQRQRVVTKAMMQEARKDVDGVTGPSAPKISKSLSWKGKGGSSCPSS
jgi:general secretion pathway protein A